MFGFIKYSPYDSRCIVASPSTGVRAEAIAASLPAAGKASMSEYKTYMCVICGFIYDEARGLPEEGIAPETRWEDVPLNWVCPECGAGKEDFELVEI
jgi:rubredoxin